MKIYLAGGMKSGWQDEAIALLPRHCIIDPRTHHLADPKEYTAWDLRGVRACDLVLAEMADDNPSGYGMMLEAGYAKAMNKRIVFIDRITHMDRRFGYFGMLRVIADFSAATITGACRWINAQ